MVETGQCCGSKGIRLVQTGGFYSISGASVLVETGATVLITSNEASRALRAGVSPRRRHNSSCLGQGTQLRVEEYGWFMGRRLLLNIGGKCFG